MARWSKASCLCGAVRTSAWVWPVFTRAATLRPVNDCSLVACWLCLLQFMSCCGHIRIVKGELFYRYGGFLGHWYRNRRFIMTLKTIQTAISLYQLRSLTAELFVNTCDEPLSFDSAVAGMRGGYPIFSTEWRPGSTDILYPDPLDLSKGYMSRAKKKVRPACIPAVSDRRGEQCIPCAVDALYMQRGGRRCKGELTPHLHPPSPTFKAPPLRKSFPPMPPPSELSLGGSPFLCRPTLHLCVSRSAGARVYLRGVFMCCSCTGTQHKQGPCKQGESLGVCVCSCAVTNHSYVCESPCEWLGCVCFLLPVAVRQIPWKKRKSHAVFRGATTNYDIHNDSNWRANPRIRLHKSGPLPLSPPLLSPLTHLHVILPEPQTSSTYLSARKLSVPLRGRECYCILNPETLIPIARVAG